MGLGLVSGPGAGGVGERYGALIGDFSLRVGIASGVCSARASTLCPPETDVAVEPLIRGPAPLARTCRGGSIADACEGFARTDNTGPLLWPALQEFTRDFAAERLVEYAESILVTETWFRGAGSVEIDVGPTVHAACSDPFFVQVLTLSSQSRGSKARSEYNFDEAKAWVAGVLELPIDLRAAGLTLEPAMYGGAQAKGERCA